MRHVEILDPLGLKPCVEVSFAHPLSNLCLDCIYNQVLDLFDNHRAWRLVVPELTALL